MGLFSYMMKLATTLLLLLATNAFGQGLRERKMDSLKMVLSSHPSDSTSIEVLFQLGRLHTIYQPDSSLYYHNEAAALSMELGYDQLLAKITYYKGTLYNSVLRDREKALSLFKEVINIGQAEWKIKGLTALSIHQIQHIGSYDSAVYYLDSCMSIAKTLDDSLVFAGIYEVKSYLHSQFGNLNKAITERYKAIEIYERANHRLLANSYLNLAAYYSKLTLYNQALELLDKALQLNLKSERESSQAQCYIRMSKIYWKQGLMNKAIDYSNRAIEIRKKVNDLSGLSDSYNLLGKIAFSEEKYDEAIRWHYNAIESNSKDQRPYNYHNSYEGLARAYTGKNQLDSAIHYFEKSKELASNNGTLEFQITSLLGLAALDTLVQKPKKAIEKSEDALAIAKTKGDMKGELDAYWMLHRGEFMKNNFKQAYRYFANYDHLKDSLFNEEKSMEFGRIDAKLEYEKKIQEQEQKARERELELEAQVLKEKYLGVTGSVMLLTILIFIGYRYRLKSRANDELKLKNEIIEKQSEELAKASEKERHFLQEQIAGKDRELAMFAMQSNAKNEVLKKLDEGIVKITSNEKEVKNLRKMIASNLQMDESWDSFMTKFEDVYPQFFSKIKSEYEQLSVSQLKVCAYIKVGMDNSEICKATNTEMSTVKKNLNRIKKKLNLDADHSIRDFLIQYV